MTIRHDGLAVSWFGYATVRIEAPDGTVVYLDPGRYGVLSGEWTPPAGATEDHRHPDPVDYHARDGDVVCVTHDHHYDSDGVRRVAGDDATVVVFDGVDAAGVDRDVDPVADLPYEVVRVSAEDHVAVDGVDVWSVPAHNDPEGPRPDAGHPPGTGCGFLVSVGDGDGGPVFWPGDSDVLPGFEELEVSLFLANICGRVAMNRHEAADLAEALDPDLVLPVHYNTLDVLLADSGAFAVDVARRGIPVVLDE